MDRYYFFFLQIILINKQNGKDEHIDDDAIQHHPSYGGVA